MLEFSNFHIWGMQTCKNQQLWIFLSTVLSLQNNFFSLFVLSWVLNILPITQRFTHSQFFFSQQSSKTQFCWLAPELGRLTFPASLWGVPLSTKPQICTHQHFRLEFSSNFIVFICVPVHVCVVYDCVHVCIFMHMYVCACMCAHLYVEALCWHQLASSVTLHLTFLRHDLSHSLQLTNSTRLTDQQ